VSLSCGIVPATNDQLYQNAYSEYGYGYNGVSDVLPYGKHRWIVIITDDYNNFLCQGVLIQLHWVLTASSCVEYKALDTLRVRMGDWDLLNDVNEYEAYKNFGERICSKYPVTDSYSYAGYGYQDSQLTLLRTEAPVNYDKYPQVIPACIPTYYPSYDYKASYPAAYPSSYPAAYNAQPSYYKEDYYSDCYVAGWYGSKSTTLQNHPKPTPAYEGYGYKAESYTPAYPSYDQSKIPRFAKVKEVKCPYEYSYGQQKSAGDEMCLVGVDGYDACVADIGAAVVCMVPEHEYPSYYPTYEPAYPSYTPPAYTPEYPSYTPTYTPAYTPSYPSYDQSYYKKEIKALVSPAKEKRVRAVVVAVVQKYAQCSDYKSYSYGSSYQAPQSKPITATKVTDKTTYFILEKYWEAEEDYSCPVWKTYYQEPAYYEPAYTPSYTPSYPSYTPSYPSYTPSYPSYTPSYPSYTPSYPSYTPDYNPPSYDYSPPAYSPPTYSYSTPAYY